MCRSVPHLRHQSTASWSVPIHSSDPIPRRFTKKPIPLTELDRRKFTGLNVTQPRKEVKWWRQCFVPSTKFPFQIFDYDDDLQR